MINIMKIKISILQPYDLRPHLQKVSIYEFFKYSQIFGHDSHK